MILLLVATVSLVVGASIFFYARRNFGKLEALGIPVVNPHHYILGSTFNSHSVMNGLRDVTWMKEFGSIYGVYEGQQPQIHICDPELIKRILVKDFQHFNCRRVQDFGSPLLNEQLDFLPAEKWKIVRQFLTPHLSAGKIKQMNKALNECMLDYVAALNAKVVKCPFGKLEDYNLKQETFSIVTDMILRCVFSIKMNRDAENNRFVKILNKLLGTGNKLLGVGESEEVGIWESIALSFPFIRKLITKPLFDKKAAAEFVKTFKGILKSRAAAGIEYGDFTDQISAILQKIQAPEYKQKGITEMTILCQVLVFFFAAQDPISSIFAVIAFYVAKNDAIREKLVHEIDRVFSAQSDKHLDPESLTQLPYLNACVNEALRLFPFFIRIERVCTQDWELDDTEGTGLKFMVKKGTVVMIPTWAANRNPKFFVDPEKFIPERFLEEDSVYKAPTLSPYALNSFGHGPRNCIGQGFSKAALIIGAAHIIRNFEFNLCNFQEGLEFEAGSLVFGTVKPIFLNVTKRNLNSK